MNLGKALQALKFDNRMTDWNLSQGLITEDELSRFNSGLEDVASQSAPLELEGEKRGSVHPPVGNTSDGFGQL